MTKVTGERQGTDRAGRLAEGAGKSNGMGFKTTMYPQEGKGTYQTSYRSFGESDAQGGGGRWSKAETREVSIG